MSLVNLLVLVLVALLLFHLLGGVAVPGYRATPFYLPGAGTILVIVLIVLVLARLL
jgi:uncharacterized membrane protein